MRVLLDSSVLIAAYISRAGVCAHLLEDVLTDHELICSDFIVGELTRKLRDKFHFPDDEISEVRNSILAAARWVAPMNVPEDSCRDPNDLPVLGTAVAGLANVLVTGDKDLLVLETFEGISIVQPGHFWKLVENQ